MNTVLATPRPTTELPPRSYAAVADSSVGPSTTHPRVPSVAHRWNNHALPVEGPSAPSETRRCASGRVGPAAVETRRKRLHGGSHVTRA